MAAVLLHGHPQLPHVTLLDFLPYLLPLNCYYYLGVGNKRMKRSVSIHSFFLRQTHYTYISRPVLRIFMMCKGTP